MQNATIKLIILLINLTISSSLFAQKDATARATATIMKSVAIASVKEMNFGLITPCATGDIITLSTCGKRTSSGGLSILHDENPVSAAAFQVMGEQGSCFSITLPSLLILTATGGETIELDTFESYSSGTGSLVSGIETIFVGAALHIKNQQASGVYSSETPLIISVNYN